MHTNVASAISVLQRRILRSSRLPDEDILEEALCDLVRNPNRTSDPDHLVGSAIARARTKLARRNKIAPIVARVESQANDLVEDKQPRIVMPAVDDSAAHELMFVRDALRRGEISAQDQRYLNLAFRGFDARDIANLEEDSFPRVSVRLSRARARARALWSEVA